MSDDTFKAATWNVFYGTDPEELRRILRRLRKDGVTVFLMQEVSNPKIRAMLREEGLRIAYAPSQYVVAYDPDVWTAVSDSKSERLSQTGYYRKGGDKVIHSDAVSVILSDRQGRTINALSYHTPPSVQKPSHLRPVRRFITTRESMTSLRDIAKNSETRAILFGGDDNFDESRTFRSEFKFMLKAFTGLTQVQSPKGTSTHGGGRRIDDFRIKGLKALAGYVLDGGGDHKAHVREFRWK